MNAQLAAVWVTAIAGGIGAWACICRLNAMSASTVTRAMRAQYVALFAACMSALLGAVLPPGVTSAVSALAVLVFLLLGMRRWANGVPRTARTDWGELQDAGDADTSAYRGER